MAKGPLVAVDIGQHSVRMLALKRTRKGADVVGAASQPIGLSPKAPAEEIAQRVAEIVKNLRKSVSGSSRRVATALNGRTAFNRYVRIPAVSGRQLRRIVQYEARQQIPFPIDQVNFDHHIIPPDPNSNEVEVMLLAVRRDVSSEAVSRLSAGGMKTDVVEVGPISLFNAYMATMGPSEDEVTAIISIGASATDIIVEQNRQLRFTRSAPFAGNALTELVANRLNVGWEEAERLKTRPASEYESIEGDGPSAVEVATILEEGFESIVGDIRRSLDFHVSQPEASPVTRVFLCGGTARMEGSAEFLEDRLGVPVTLADFTASEEFNWSIPNRADYASEGVLAGLAARCASRAALELNVAPDYVMQRLELERRAPMLMLCGLLLAGLLFAGFSGVQKCIDRDRQALQRIEDVVNPTGIGPRQIELRDLRASQQKFTDRYDRLSHVAKKRGLITQRYLEVRSMVPEEVWLTTVLLDSSKMTLEGKALNDDRLQEFVWSLRLSPYLKAEGVAQTNIIPAGDGSIDFTIEAAEFNDPSKGEIDFIDNLRKLLDVTIILAYLEEAGGGGPALSAMGPGMPPGPQVSRGGDGAKSVKAVVGVYEIPKEADRVA
ncbi:MAG: type IV pilus assembly protein PilM, partial [bacterium]